MNLCQLKTFFLTFGLVCCAVCKPCVFAANQLKSEGKNVQLAEVHFYRSYFLQNPYFSARNFTVLKIMLHT